MATVADMPTKFMAFLIFLKAFMVLHGLEADGVAALIAPGAASARCARTTPLGHKLVWEVSAHLLVGSRDLGTEPTEPLVKIVLIAEQGGNQGAPAATR